jgi:hypothetical protein
MSIFSWAKAAGALALVFLVAIALARYRYLVNEAALVPQLEARIVSDEKQTTALSARLAATEAARGAADRALSRFETDKDAVLATLTKESRHVAAESNPVCAPSDGDRRLRNAALARLLAGD